MKNCKIGLQLFSVKPYLIEDMKGTLTKVAEMGYDGVEFAGYFDHSAEEIREICDSLGLEIISVHQKYPTYLETPEETIKFVKTLGIKYSAIPHVPIDQWLNDYAACIAGIKKAGAMLKENDIQLLFHNHFYEFINNHNDKLLFDSIFEDVGLDLMQPEFDLGWVLYAGFDPVEYIEKYKDSIKLIHMRDLECTLLPKGRLYDMNEQRNTAGTKCIQALEGVQSRPVGGGRQDFTSIMNALKETNAEYLIVELSEREGVSCFDDCKASLDYIKGML